jgi:hypothetical protein
MLHVIPTSRHPLGGVSNWGMASIRLYTLTVVFVLVEWNNAVFYSNSYEKARERNLLPKLLLISGIDVWVMLGEKELRS